MKNKSSWLMVCTMCMCLLMCGCLNVQAKKMGKRKFVPMSSPSIMWRLISGLLAMMIRWDMKCYGRKELESGKLSKRKSSF